MAATKIALGQARRITLPDLKIQVLARQSSLISLIARGVFPRSLVGGVWKSLRGELTLTNAAGDPDALIQACQLIDAYLPHVLIEPKAGPETTYDDAGTLTQLAIADLPDPDKLFLYYWGQRAAVAPEDKEDTQVVQADDLAPFPRDGASPEPRPAGATVRAEAVQASGPLAG